MMLVHAATVPYITYSGASTWSSPSITACRYDNSHKLSKHQKKVPYIYRVHTTDDLERAFRLGNFPTRPSNLFLKAFSDVMQSVESNPGSDIVPNNLIATTGSVPMTINAPYDSLLAHYRDCIVNAQSEIMFAAGFWKVGKATKLIVDAFRELNNRIAQRGGQKVVIKILWARGSIAYHKKNTPKQKQKLTLPTPTECPFIDFETMDMHKMVLGVFHVKYLIVDRKMLLISSTNIQGKPNVEFSVHLEGGIVDSFYNCFCQQWSLDFVPPLPLANTPAPQKSGFDFAGQEVHGPCIYHTEHADVPMFLANKIPTGSFGRNHWEAPQNVAWMSLMHHAQRSIVIQTPDFNAALAIEAVIDACKRGIHVTIMLSWVYNALKERFFQGGTNIHVIKAMYKKLMKLDCHRNLTVFFYVARTQFHPTKVHPNHTKFMAVDDEVAIFGSGNMDTQSWHHSQETNIAVNSPLLVKEWMDLFKISQNTHLFGMIDPNQAESPVSQIRRILSKQNTQPTHVSPAMTQAPFINNSQLPIHSEAEFSSRNEQPNNFNQYYNTFRGIYNQSENLQASTNSAPPPLTNSITNVDFFNNTAAPVPANTTTTSTTSSTPSTLTNEPVPVSSTVPSSIPANQNIVANNNTTLAKEYQMPTTLPHTASGYATS